MVYHCTQLQSLSWTTVTLREASQENDNEIPLKLQEIINSLVASVLVQIYWFNGTDFLAFCIPFLDHVGLM